MDTKEIYALIDKFETSSLTELSLELETIKLELKRGTETEQVQMVPKRKKEQEQEEIKIVEVDEYLKMVKSPLVGTFYRASGPDAKPYAMVGQKVKKGDVIALIEAMKLMNEVVSPVDGIIEEIVAENEGLVQYEEVILTIRESNHV